MDLKKVKGGGVKVQNGFKWLTEIPDFSGTQNE